MADLSLREYFRRKVVDPGIGVRRCASGIRTISLRALLIDMLSPFEKIVYAYDGYDLDVDRLNEIESLKFLWYRNHAFGNPSEAVDLSKKLVIVITESRLFDNLSGSRYTTNDLLQRLLNFENDLNKEGYVKKFFEMTPYHGLILQDGKTLLAIREFFKTVYKTFSNFEGVVLIGSFPHAKITRMYPQHEKGKLDGVDGIECYREGGFFWATPRFDLVLADLYGNWRNLYQIKWVHDRHTYFKTAATNVNQYGSKMVLTNPRLVLNEEEQPPPGPVYDTFLIQDASYRETHLPNGTLQVEFDLIDKDPEVSNQNMGKPNRIATPNICVSRINARSIAVQPPSTALDANRKPQTTTTYFSPEDWVHDANLERTLLIEYFDRNHAFRNGKFAGQGFRISFIESKNYGTFSVDEGLNGLNAPRDPMVSNATPLDFICWLKHPVLFRAISTHASCRETELFKVTDADAIIAESEAGGHPWRWIDENGKYVPSFKGYDRAGLELFRTLWENRQLVNICPSLLLHVGCDVNSPDHGDKPYNDNLYGTFQNAESLLFYANQLAILCHVTWWNRGPRGFGNKFGSSETATFGDGWKGFFEVWSQDPSLGLDRKRCYEWSIVGDWTLRKYYRP